MGCSTLMQEQLEIGHINEIYEIWPTTDAVSHDCQGSGW